MKKRYMILTAAVLLGILAGCSSEPETEPNAGTDVAGEETSAQTGGELSILAPSDAVNEGTYAMIDAFEQKYRWNCRRTTMCWCPERRPVIWVIL